MYNCSSANFYGTGNRGIFFGSAFNCSSDAPTIENVQGRYVVFGQGAAAGTTSDKYSAAYCFVQSPRFYNPGGDPLVGATRIEFAGSASQCAVRNVPTFSALVGQKMVRFLESCASCSVEILSGGVAPAAISSYVDFTSADPSNVVRVFTNDTATKQSATFAPASLFVERYTDGTVVTHTQFYTAVQLATDWRFCKKDGTQIMSVSAGGTFKLNTAILPTAGVGDSGTVWRDAAAGNVLKIIP